MKNLAGLFWIFSALILFNIFCSAQENYKHKSKDEIAAMTPTERVEEMMKEQYYHYPVGAGHNQGEMLREYILKDGIKVLPALVDIAKNYDPVNQRGYKQSQAFIAFHLAKEIDNNVVRIRTTEEGRSLIKALEDILSRMKNAGYADNQHKLNKTYLAYLDDLKSLQGKDYNLTDGNIRTTLRIKHNIQMSDEEMIEFSNYLTSLDPAYPSNCKIDFPPPVCINSKEYYEAYLKFKTEMKQRF